MKHFVLFHKTSQFAVVFFILIQLTAILCNIYECPKEISEYCKCDDKQNTIFFRCTINDTEVSLKSGWRSTLTFNCTNVNDGELFELMNFNENNQNIVVNVVKINSCPAPVISLIESRVIRHIKQTSLEIVMTDGKLMPDNFFSSQRFLENLDLKRNNLIDLPENIFYNLTKLKKLILNENKLSALPTNIFQNQTELIELHLNGNNLTTLDEHIFRHLTKLKILYLDENQLTTLPENLFINLTKLVDLDLSRNKLLTLPPNIFNATPHRQLELQLAGNPWLCDCDFLQIVRERESKVDLNEIECPDEDPMRYKIDRPILSMILNKAGDRINYDDPEYANLTFCEIMPTNNLTRICPTGCNCLIFKEETSILIDCSNVELKSVPDGLGNDILKLLPKLEHIELNFDHNQLGNLPVSTMPGFNLTTKISAKNNSIEFITVHNLPENVTEIDLSGNKMKYLSLPVIRNISDMKMLKKLFLSENPWSCDCDFLDIIRQHKSLVDYDKIKCTDKEFINQKLNHSIVSVIKNKPGTLNAKNIPEFINSTMCDIHSTNKLSEMCSPGCNCLIDDNKTTIVFDCSNSNLESVPWRMGNGILEEMPSLQEIHLNFENNRIETLPFSTMKVFKLVTKLLAKNNAVKTIHASNLPPRLTRIDLRENRLEYLSSAVTNQLTDMKTLRRIDLMGNPWACDVTFLEFIRNNMEKVDYNTIVCPNREPLFRRNDHFTFWIKDMEQDADKPEWIKSSEIVRKIDHSDYLASLCPLNCNCFIQEMNTTVLYHCSENNYTNIYSHFESARDIWPSLNLTKVTVH